ncbi:MAG TPA: hypothetical protein VJ914_06830 [Pseudonocardiaceae bacterium]|nr:hypothetical protein [Pseudonocardiaceae bacterium]
MSSQLNHCCTARYPLFAVAGFLIDRRWHGVDQAQVVGDDRGALDVARADTADQFRGEADLAAEHGVRQVHVAHVGQWFVAHDAHS